MKQYRRVDFYSNKMKNILFQLLFLDFSDHMKLNSATSYCWRPRQQFPYFSKADQQLKLLSLIMLINYHTEFLTGTIYGWHHLLKADDFKKVVVDSFEWLVIKKKCMINAFVIMPNHFHLIWKISNMYERKNVQGALFSFTAHEFKNKIENSRPDLLGNFLVNKVDREYQFWEREPMVKECWTKKFFQQKFNYTHFNPCQPQWNLSDVPENYEYSSARFYETGVKDFSFLTHFNEA